MWTLISQVVFLTVGITATLTATATCIERFAEEVLGSQEAELQLVLSKAFQSLSFFKEP